MSTGVAPEAVGSLASRDFGVDGAPIRGKLLFSVREPPAPQGKAQRMARGREGDSQCKRHRAPGDRFQRSNGVHDVLGPVLEGIDVRIRGSGGAVRREVVAVDGLDHTKETVRIRGTSQDGDPAGSGQANSGSAVP